MKILKNLILMLAAGNWRLAAGGCFFAGGWLLVAGSWLLATASAHAHHSFAAQYDSNQPVTLQGYVTKVEWYNPHVYFYIDVENAETGETENWGIEMGPPHMLQNAGWKRNDMQIGDELLVVATRARDGSATANARSVKMVATGKVLGAASSESQTLTGREASD